MTYNAPIQEMLFLFDKVLMGERVLVGKFKDIDKSAISDVLKEVAKFSENILVPINRDADINPPTFNGGNVKCNEKYKEAYSALSTGGWIGISGDQKYGGMGLPSVLTTCINEILSSGCMALSLNALMTQGQIEALENHADDRIKEIYLPKLNSGEWSGTMNLTEPQAGSDVGALKTKAEKCPDGKYKITGQKIYISWGDHDLNKNICHLVLARVKGAPEGTKGISLFLVPKIIPDLHGEPDVRNGVISVSMEEKFGLHGSPTMVIQYSDAIGWLIGEENQGLTAMFTMMNNARLGVGVEGLSQSERAYQKALNFAKDRVQGKNPKTNLSTEIINHADVRRNLLDMKALTVASRALCMDCAINIDIANIKNDEGCARKAGLLTPIAKAFSTDVANKITEIGIQIHGGMGFIEETGAAQFYRDARVTSIYEGTNGIQAMDLVGRKMNDGGEAAQGLISEIKSTENLAINFSIEQKELLTRARIKLQEATNWMLNCESMNERYAGSSPFLKAFGYVLGAHYLLKSAVVSDDEDKNILSQYFLKQVLPEAFPLFDYSVQGSELLYAYNFKQDYES